MPVSIIFDNLAAGMTIDEVMEEFDVSRDEVTALLAFVTHSLEKTPVHS
jgi:uncharacterized protein (DUF433 family)